MCGTEESPLHVDHIWPIAMGGGNELDNLQLLCERHNLEKGARIVDGARPPQYVRPFDALAADLKMSADPLDHAAVVRAAIANGKERWAIEAVLREIDTADDPVALIAACKMLRSSEQGVSLAEARLAQLIAVEAPAAALELAGPHLDAADATVRGTASLAVAEAEPDMDRDRQVELLTTATHAEDHWVAGLAHLYLAELNSDPDLAREHLLAAAESRDATPSSEAAYQLGRQSEDADEARQWFRRALITEDPDLFAACAAELALLTGGEQGCAYARHALDAEDAATVGLAHLVLGLEGDDDPRAHLEQALRCPDPMIRDEAQRALSELGAVSPRP